MATYIKTLKQNDDIIAPRTKTGAITDSNNVALDTILAGKETADATILKQANVVNSTSSTSTIYPLSANMGKELQDEINNLKARGRFLSIWNCITGLATTSPTTLPYDYKTGDYFIVGFTSLVNYRPSGSQYIGVASIVSEQSDVGVNDTYYYDGSNWVLLHTSQSGVSFSSIAGSPYDNTNLGIALNEKQDLMSAGTRISISSEGTISTSASEVSVNSEGTSTTKVKYIKVNGNEYLMGSDDPTEYTTKLQEDLYTYTPIGKITGASQTNPVKVADAGDPLKDVFNAILGTEVDVNPTISQSGTTFTKSGQTGTTSEAGGEVGKTINAQTGTVTWHVTNAGTCTYGLKAGPYDTYSKTSQTQFNYPTKTRSITVGETAYNYQIAISYPVLNGCTLSVTAGTLVVDDTTNRILYCNLDDNRDVKVSISIPSGASTTSAQTRFNTMTANVEFDAPVYNNNLVENFWTYLKASYTATGMTPPSQKSASSTAYTIGAGSYYTYYKVTNDTTHVATGWTSVGSNSIADITVAAAVGQYIWFASNQNKTAIYEWNDVSGKYNTDPTDTTKASGQTIHTNTGLDTNVYYTYRTAPRSGATNKKFKLA